MLSLGRAPAPDGGEIQLDRADANRIAVDESGNRIEPTFSDERAVLAFEILDRRFVAGDGDPRMTPGDIWRIEEQLEIRVAAKHVLPVGQTDAAARPTPAGSGRLFGTSGAGLATGSRGRVSERITKPVDGPDEPRVRRVVAEGSADLGDKIDEVLLEHEGLGPEPSLEVLASTAPSAC